MALNFALQELRIYYNNIYELRFEEGKEKKGTPMKVHFNIFLILVVRQAIKPQHIITVGLSSFKLPLAAGRLPIFKP